MTARTLIFISLALIATAVVAPAAAKQVREKQCDRKTGSCEADNSRAQQGYESNFRSLESTLDQLLKQGDPQAIPHLPSEDGIGSSLEQSKEDTSEVKGPDALSEPQSSNSEPDPAIKENDDGTPAIVIIGKEPPTAKPVIVLPKPETSLPAAPAPAMTRASVQPAALPKPGRNTYFFKTCAEAWMARKAPLIRGQDGYREALDPDGDGRACETMAGRDW